VGHPLGRRVLTRLVAVADVFVTSVRSGARARLGIDVVGIRADNPAVIYVRGTAFGPAGPDAARGGYDTGAYWARSGMQHLLTPPGAAVPPAPPPAFGDLVGGLTIAGAIGTALFRRATTGEPSVFDASLLASGMWQIQPDISPTGAHSAPGPTRDRRIRPERDHPDRSSRSSAEDASAGSVACQGREQERHRTAAEQASLPTSCLHRERRAAAQQATRSTTLHQPHR
jgi:crotonobetainyl-CoA:carnitine CoA-transferase CaiB-like acyl-CoA transferase